MAYVSDQMAVQNVRVAAARDHFVGIYDQADGAHRLI